MAIPSLQQTDRLIRKARGRNPGDWLEHSLYTAKAAATIAEQSHQLDPEIAFIFGYLHDIGRQEGPSGMRHIIFGYTYLESQGYDCVARICLTHSFPTKDIGLLEQKWDGTSDELRFVRDFIKSTSFTIYDKLIQLCDALALPTGYCLIEKRLVDVAMRRGIGAETVEHWRGYFQIKNEFEDLIGGSVYTFLPGIVQNTFGTQFTYGERPGLHESANHNEFGQVGDTET